MLEQLVDGDMKKTTWIPVRDYEPWCSKVVWHICKRVNLVSSEN